MIFNPNYKEVDIKGYEGLYKISNKGDVISLHYNGAFNKRPISIYNFDTKGWTPRPTITIDCVEIEIAPDNWIMAVDANNTNLLLLNAYYNIQWEECSCLRGIRLEDVTVELEKEAYEEMRHNI